MVRTLCPQRPRLNVLVQGRLAEDEQRRLADHLDHCPDCQERAEELTELGGWTPNDLTRTAPQLRRVIDAMKNKDLLTAPGVGLTLLDDRLLLSFLRPAGQRNCLGLLDGYEVTEVLGRGGMGIVVKAFDPSLERYVAIKVLAPQLAASPGARERFAREARAAAAINHEHVVAIHAVSAVDGLPYLVMEYVPGLSLQECLDRDSPLAVPDILRIGAQVAAGLAAAHAQGLIHRDIKPGNILLALSSKSRTHGQRAEDSGIKDGGPETRDQYTPKISDFGLARTADDASLTQSGMLAGTPHYMAPEQARGEAVDFRADLFSLGSVLYALCTGQPPFPGSSTLAVLRQVSQTMPPSVRRLNPHVPQWLDDLIARLHSPRPADRFRSATEVAELLEGCLAHVQNPQVVLLPPELAACSRRRRPLRRWAVSVAVLIGLAGSLGVAGLGLHHRGSAKQSQSCVPSAPPQTGTADPDHLSWVPVDPEHQVQIAGRKVRVASPSGTVSADGSALELNLKLPGRHRARILIFGLPGIAVNAGPCARTHTPMIGPRRSPGCPSQPGHAPAADEARADSPEPLLCLVFPNTACPAAALSGLGSVICWQAADPPTVIWPAIQKDRIARRPAKQPGQTVLTGPVEG